MPTYTVTNSNFNLTSKQQKNLAEGITKVHNIVTGANTYFAQVIFNKTKKNSPFENCGCMVDGRIITSKVFPNFDGKYIHLENVLESGKVDEEFYIDEKDLDKWNYLKGSKKEIRKSKDGFEYNYSEGGMIFPDSLDNASRTIITGEGGKSPSRFKHVINTKYGLRRLTPIELERLNGFPDNHTKMEGISNAKRAFFMGNALICGVVEKIGKELC